MLLSNHGLGIQLPPLKCKILNHERSMRSCSSNSSNSWGVVQTTTVWSASYWTSSSVRSSVRHENWRIARRKLVINGTVNWSGDTGKAMALIVWTCPTVLPNHSLLIILVASFDCVIVAGLKCSSIIYPVEDDSPVLFHRGSSCSNLKFSCIHRPVAYTDNSPAFSTVTLAPDQSRGVAKRNC